MREGKRIIPLGWPCGYIGAMLGVPQVTLAAQGCSSAGRSRRLHAAWQPWEGRAPGEVHCPAQSGFSHWEWARKPPGPDQEQSQKGRSRRGPRHRALEPGRECEGQAAQRGHPGEPCLGRGAVAPQQQAAGPLQERRSVVASRLFQGGWVSNVEPCFWRKNKKQTNKKTPQVQQDF